MRHVSVGHETNGGYGDGPGRPRGPFQLTLHCTDAPRHAGRLKFESATERTADPRNRGGAHSTCTLAVCRAHHPNNGARLTVSAFALRLFARSTSSTTTYLPTGLQTSLPCGAVSAAAVAFGRQENKNKNNPFYRNNNNKYHKRLFVYFISLFRFLYKIHHKRFSKYIYIYNKHLRFNVHPCIWNI